MKVLIAEDDPNTRSGLEEILSEEGYEVVAVGDGNLAWESFCADQPDVVCLDIMMPEIDGYEVCRRIRSQTDEPAVLFISAKSEEIDTVLGLELGADDFIQKPFGVKEVVARIRAVTRRIYTNKDTVNQSAQPAEDFTMDDIRVVPSELRGFRGSDETPIELSLRDIQILKYLKDNQGVALSRDSIFDQCWGFDYLPNSRTLDQHVSKLRKKIEIDPKEPKIIKTVHGVGYRFD